MSVCVPEPHLFRSPMPEITPLNAVFVLFPPVIKLPVVSEISLPPASEPSTRSGVIRALALAVLISTIVVFPGPLICAFIP